MKHYLLILRDHERLWDQFGPDELQATLERFAAWNASMRDKEAFVGAGKLASDLGTTVRARQGELVVDGPYSEAKEAVSGYFCVRARDADEAAEIAKGCPILTYGGSVEVRELAVLQSE